MRILIDDVEYIPKRIITRHKKKLSTLIKNARVLNKETLEESSIIIGTSKSHLWAIEKGKVEPGLKLLQALLKHFDINFNEIKDIEHASIRLRDY